MSHFSFLNVKISNPDISILKRAIEILARELNGSVSDAVYDYYGNKMSVIAGVVGGSFRRGIGVVINNDGGVSVVGDFYGVSRDAVDDFVARLTQLYTSIAIAESLRELGYSVVSEEHLGQIYIRAVG